MLAGMRDPSPRSLLRHAFFGVACVAILNAPLVPAAEDSPGPPHLLPIAAIVADTDFNSPYPVTVRGVVTWRRNRGLIIQEDDAGIWIDAQRSVEIGLWRGDDDLLDRLRPGVAVEVDGLADRGGYVPNVLAIAIRMLGERPEPPPLPIDPKRFFFGLDCCRRVTVRGVVQGVRDDDGDWTLLMSDASRDFTASIPQALLPDGPTPLVDAELRLVGVSVSHFNTRGEFLAPWLRVVHAEDIVVERPSETTAMQAPEIPLRAIAQYHPRRREDHRIRTRGTVTYATPGKVLYLQEGFNGVRVETEQSHRFEPGDRVEVAGFTQIQGRVAGIVEADVRRIEAGSPLAPIDIDPDTILEINADASRIGQMAEPGDFQGCLVTFPAQIVDFQRSAIGGQVLLAAGEIRVSGITTTDDIVRLLAIEPGSVVQATGIVQFATNRGDERLQISRPFEVDRLELLVRSANDIVVLRAASWWKPRRLAALLAAVATAAAVAAGWVVLLRRKVAAQLAVIESKIQAEAATEERQRIAREFHDTLEQGLAAVSLRLDVAACTVADERSRSVLEHQRQILSGLQTETRDFLWDLRDPVHAEGTLVESLSLHLHHLQELSAAPVRLDVEGLPPVLPRTTHYHLLRIVREAVYNAIKHAKATRILVHVVFRPSSFAITVEDDGTGFDVAVRSQAEGHFGIRGMQERARQVGARYSIDSRPEAGTRVSIELPLPPTGLGNGGPQPHDA